MIFSPPKKEKAILFSTFFRMKVIQVRQIKLVAEHKTSTLEDSAVQTGFWRLAFADDAVNQNVIQKLKLTQPCASLCSC